MKRVIRIIAISLAFLILAVLAASRIWLSNPYEDELRLDPRSVFSEESIPHDFLIRNAAMIDVVEGRVVPNTHIHIRNDSIAGVYHGGLPDTLEYNIEYDAQGTYLRELVKFIQANGRKPFHGLVKLVTTNAERRHFLQVGRYPRSPPPSIPSGRRTERTFGQGLAMA